MAVKTAAKRVDVKGKQKVELLVDERVVWTAESLVAEMAVPLVGEKVGEKVGKRAALLAGATVAEKVEMRVGLSAHCWVGSMDDLKEKKKAASRASRLAAKSVG